MSDSLLAGRYKLGAIITHGVLADYYEATDQVLLRKTVISILRTNMTDNIDHINRLRAKARLNAQLNHPGIVSVYDWAETGGKFFIVMEHVNGGSLADAIKTGGSVPSRRAVEIAASVADALTEAHSKNVCHGDITTRNILIAEEGTVKLAGFASLSPEEDSETTADRTNVIPGQGQPRSNAPSEQSDIHSLGAVLYEMLTGVSPPADSGRTNLAVNHRSPAAGGIACDETSPGFSSAAADIAIRCLAEPPSCRYRSAKELKQELTALLECNPSGVDANLTKEIEPTAEPADVETCRTAVVPAVPAEAPASLPRRGRRRRMLSGGWWTSSSLPYILGSVMSLAILLTAMLIVFNGFSSGQVTAASSDGAPQLKVPDVIGRYAGESKQLLQSAGFRVESVEENTADVKTGLVIRTNPPAGETVPQDSLVIVVVSAGASNAVVPDLLGEDQNTAVSRLVESGFVLGGVRIVYDNELASGKVAGQIPEGGSSTVAGDEVFLMVTDTPTPVTMPYLLELTRSRAERRLAEIGVRVITLTMPKGANEGNKEGMVVSQDPEAGTPVNPGWAAIIMVTGGGRGTFNSGGSASWTEDDGPQDSSIIAETPLETSGLVYDMDTDAETVPDLTGLSVDKARELTEVMGFHLVISQSYHPVADPSKSGRIVRQLPSPHSASLDDRSIRVTLGEHTPT